MAECLSKEEYWRQRGRERYRRMHPNANPRGPRPKETTAPKQNPCCICQYPIGDCPFLSSHAKNPVPGWDAERTKKGGIHIIRCPLYVAPPKDRKTDNVARLDYCKICGKKIPEESRHRYFCSDECAEISRGGVHSCR